MLKGLSWPLAAFGGVRQRQRPATTAGPGQPRQQRADSVNSNLDGKALSLRPELEEKLLAGQRAMRRVHCRVSSLMLGLGIACGVAGGIAYDWKATAAWDQGLAWSLLVIGMLLIALSPVRGDLCLTRWVIAGNMCLAATDIYWSVFFDVGDLRNFYSAAYVVVDSTFIAGSILIIVLCQSVDRLQQVMWRLLLGYFLCQTLVDTFELLDPWLQYELDTPYGKEGNPPPFTYFLVGDLIGVVCSALSCFRHAVHRSLSRMFSRKGAEAAAASIAALIGECHVGDVVSQAARRFRCVLLSELERSDLASSSPSPDLHERTRKIKLGECDAFISHSWSDDEGAKWAALRRWCDAFEEKRGREPTLWLDKCCIDQTDIEANLRCLPVFLSGCRQLVVLCGPTFFSRLWCVLEIFTHYHMGLGKGRLTVVQVLREGLCDDDAQAVQWQADHFDVLQCNCSSPADMQKITEVIFAAFGSPDAFNEAIRKVMRAAGRKRAACCEQHAADDDSADDESDDDSDGSDSSASMEEGCCCERFRLRA